MKIKIIVDSASDISKEQAEQMGIEMIPMEVTFGEESYLDGVELLPTQFYEKLIESNILPKTSQINEYRWAEVFEKYTNEGYEVVAVTISSKLSGTFDSAQKAAKKFEGKVKVVDSMSAAVGERMLCEYALRLINEGKDANFVAEELDKVKSKINIMIVLNTIEYLRKGGRISPAVAFAGKLLSIKPVAGLRDGKVVMLGKAMGSKNGNNLLNKLVNEKGGIDFSMPYGVIYSGLDDNVMKKYVQDSSALWKDYTEEVPAYLIGGTIGTHVGPGGVGVAFFEK